MTDRQNAATRRPTELLSEDDVTITMFWISIIASAVYLLGQTFWYFPERGALIATVWTAGLLILGVLEYVR